MSLEVVMQSFAGRHKTLCVRSYIVAAEDGPFTSFYVQGGDLTQSIGVLTDRPELLRQIAAEAMKAAAVLEQRQAAYNAATGKAQAARLDVQDLGERAERIDVDEALSRL